MGSGRVTGRRCSRRGTRRRRGRLGHCWGHGECRHPRLVGTIAVERTPTDDGFDRSACNTPHAAKCPRARNAPLIRAHEMRASDSLGDLVRRYALPDRLDAARRGGVAGAADICGRVPRAVRPSLGRKAMRRRSNGFPAGRPPGATGHPNGHWCHHAPRHGPRGAAGEVHHAARSHGNHRGKPVPLDDRRDEAETQANPLCAPAFVGAIEAPRHRLVVGRIDPGAGVRDPNDRAVGPGSRLTRTTRPRAWSLTALSTRFATASNSRSRSPATGGSRCPPSRRSAQRPCPRRSGRTVRRPRGRSRSASRSPAWQGVARCRLPRCATAR